MRCTVKYSELYKQLFGLILIPLILVVIFLLLIFLFKALEINEIVMNIIIYGGSFLVIIFGVLLVKKYVMITGEAEYDEKGIKFELENYSIFYKTTAKYFLYENIQKIVFDETENYRTYVKIITKKPAKTIYISPDKYENTPAFIDYWNDVKSKIEQNLSN